MRTALIRAISTPTNREWLNRRKVSGRSRRDSTREKLPSARVRSPVSGKDDQIPEVEIQLQETRAISGCLLDGDGKPMVHNSVIAQGRVDPTVFERWARTDEKGCFRFTLLPESLYTLMVPEITAGSRNRDPDRGRLILAENLTPGTLDRAYHLPRGSTLVLRLHDEEGNPVTSMPEIDFGTAQKKAFLGLRIDFVSWPGEIESLGSGTFRLAHLPQGTFCIQVRVKGYGVHGFSDLIIPPPGGRLNLSANLDKEAKASATGTISGMVRYADGSPATGILVLKAFEARRNSPFSKGPSFDGMPRNKERERENVRIGFTAERIRTRCAQNSGSRLQYTALITDDEGCFVFDAQEMGVHDIYFRVNGLEVDREGPLNLTERNLNAVLDITLPRLNGSIEGRVSDRLGRALAGACVVAWDGDKVFNITLADSSGRFGFVGLPAGNYVVDSQSIPYTAFGSITPNYTATIPRKQGLAALDAYNAVVPENGACSLNLVLADPWSGSLDITVGVQGSRPLPDAFRIRLFELERDAGLGEENSVPRFKPSDLSITDLFTYNNRSSLSKTLQAPGRYQYRNLRPGRYQAVFTWSSDSSDLNIIPGSAFVPQEWDRSEVFSIDSVSTKKIDMLFSLASLRGTVVLAESGRPACGARMILVPESLQKRVSMFDSPSLMNFKTRGSFAPTIESDGTFHIKDIPAGAYHLALLHADCIPRFEKGFWVEADVDQMELCFPLVEGGCKVQGIIEISEESRPMPFPSFWSCFVAPVLPPFGELMELGVRVEKDGRFVLAGLPSGPVKLAIICAGKKVLEKTVILPLAEGETIVIKGI